MNNLEKLNDQSMEEVVGGISQDQALAAALKRAGLKKEQLDFVKRIELDYEHGRKVYEICFYKDGMEYEFDVDAANGQILKYSKEFDD